MALKLAASLDRNWLYPEQPASIFLLLEVMAPEALSQEGTRQNLAFVLDRSGSMAGKKLDYTKQAVSFASGHLTRQDAVSLTVFDSHVDVLYPGGPLTNRDLLKQRIAGIQPGGSTNLSGGMLAGFEEVRKNQAEGQVNRVLLLTDGQVNVGVTGHEALVAKAAQIRQAGVTLSTFGLGAGFQEDLLIAMAEAGGGNFYYIDSPDSIPGIFEQELTGLLTVVAQNLSLRVSPGPGVKVMGVMGYPGKFEGETFSAGLADIYAGERKLLLVELGVTGHSEGKCLMAQIELKYSGVEADLALERTEVTITLPVTTSPGEGPEENFDVVRKVELFRAAEARDRAVEEADKGNYASGRAIIENQIARMQEMGLDSAELGQAVASLQANIDLMSMESYSDSVRKEMRTESYQARKGKNRKE